jgi:hypothetical protein
MQTSTAGESPQEQATTAWGASDGRASVCSIKHGVIAQHGEAVPHPKAL